MIDHMIEFNIYLFQSFETLLITSGLCGTSYLETIVFMTCCDMIKVWKLNCDVDDNMTTCST